MVGIVIIQAIGHPTDMRSIYIAAGFIAFMAYLAVAQIKTRADQYTRTRTRTAMCERVQRSQRKGFECTVIAKSHSDLCVCARQAFRRKLTQNKRILSAHTAH